jgi:dTDP-glucose 4,6-dehydratase
MKVLVCGGLGFKGINFIMYLLDKYQQCTVVNIDKETPYSNLDFRYLGDHYKNYVYMQGDIGNKQLIHDTLRSYDINYVINFSECGYKGEIEEEYVKNNISALLNLIEECRLYSINKFIQISTNQVYGNTALGEATEESGLKPGSLYGASKASGDLVCMAYYNMYGFPVTIVRVCDSFGPYQNTKNFIPRIITKAVSDEKISVHGDGLNIREWIYIRDAVEAIDRLLVAGRIGQIYNLGGDQRKRDIEIIEYILDYLHKPKNLLYYRGEKIALLRKRMLDSSKLKREVLWRPKYGFYQSIDNTIEWYLHNSNAVNI